MTPPKRGPAYWLGFYFALAILVALVAAAVGGVAYVVVRAVTG